MPGEVAAHLAWLRLRGLRPSTVATRASRLRHLAVSLSMTTAGLLDLTETDLTAWQRSLTITPAAHCAYVSHVQQYYRWALRDGRIDADPSMNLIHPKVPRRVPRPISEADLSLAVAAAGDRVRPFLILAGWAGLRAAEIARLERADIMDNEDPPVLFITGKGNKQRVVPMSSKVRYELRGRMPASGYVFSRRDGNPGPNKPWMVSHLANCHLHGLGINDTLHSLRHRFGTRLYAECQDLRIVQEIMGHESPSTTAGYVQYSKQRAFEAVEALTA